MKQIIKLVSLLTALFLLIVSCSAPEVPADITPDLVSVTFQNLEAKTTTVSSGTVDNVAIASVYFQYKAENVSGLKQGEVTEWTDLSARPGLNTVIKLGRGIWHMYLRGFATAEARTAAGTAETSDTTAIFAGEIETFSAGNGSSALTANADVPLEFTNATGKGSCEIEVTFDEAYANVENKRVNVRIVCGTTDETKTLTFGENGAEVSDTAVFENVDNGIATITVDYLDTDGTPFGDSGTATTLIMTDMTTKTSATISMDVVKLTVVGSRPAGSAGDYFAPKVFNSIFDIYPDNIADNAIVIGYAEETKALDQIPITYPYEVSVVAEKDAQGRYTASSLGLVPITVTNRADLNTSGATEAWYGKSVVYLSSSYAPSNTTLEKVRFVDGVTTIGSFAFYGCSGLTDITIPDSVTSIGWDAFDGCSSLTSITIPDSVTSIGDYAFNGCSSLTSIMIPDGVTSISDGAFKGCSSLTSATIGSGVTSIGKYTFQGCSGLTSIVIPNNVTSIGEAAFFQCFGLTSITIPERVTTIGSSAFYGCNSLTSITIPDGVTSISGSAFYGCSGLTDITIPDSVKTIASNAFDGCSGLTSITIPAGVTSIGNYAFQKCTGLTSVTIPDSVTTIGISAFSGCSGLSDVIYGGTVDQWYAIRYCMDQTLDITCKDGKAVFRIDNFGTCNNLTPYGKTLSVITIPDNVTSIGVYAFDRCSGLTSITIPAGVKTIGSNAFRGCSGLTSITIPDNVTIIASNVFEGCSGLTSIVIPNNVTSIGIAAFKGCSGLTTITIPDNVTSIDNAAFDGCSELTSITIPAGVTSISSNIFHGCNKLTDIYVNQAESSLLANTSLPSGCKIHWNSTGPKSV